MRYAGAVLLGLGLLSFYLPLARANSFDECVLQNMRGVTSDFAAKSIKVACLRNSSIDIPQADLAGLGGRAEYSDFGEKFGRGFWIRLENKTDYIVTEVTLKVQVGEDEIQTFRTDDFWAPQKGVIYTSLPPDPTRTMQIQRFGSVQYRVIAPQVGIDMKKQNFK